MSSQGHRRQNEDDEHDEHHEGVKPARKPVEHAADDVDFEEESENQEQDKEWHILSSDN